MKAKFLLPVLLTLAQAWSTGMAEEEPAPVAEQPAQLDAAQQPPAFEQPVPAQPIEGQPAQIKAAQAYQKGVMIEVTGVILPLLQKYVDRKLEQAQQLGADLVILEIDSPGGELDATWKIADRLRDLEWAHTVAYIPNEALSGAAIISLGCDEIVMGPQARLGDAGPIFLGPDQLFHHAPEKIRSDLARRVRDLASSTGRPPALAEAMVDMNLTVYRVTNTQTGEITFMSQHEIDASEHPNVWQQGPPVLESREGSFLEVNGVRAVELQLASATATSLQELEQRFPVAEQPIIQLRHNAVDTAVGILNLPLVTALLFVIGAIALWVELSAPGIGLGGLISGLCFTLFFWSRFLGGTAGWLEVILVLAGAVFLAVELFVTPGFGIAGVTGLVLMAAGILLASQDQWIPQSPRAMAQLGNSLLVLLGSAMVSLIGVVIVSRFYGSVPILNRLVLHTPAAAAATGSGEKGLPLPPVKRFQANVGDWGVSDSPLRPAGKAIFGEDYLDVVTDGSFVERGRQIRIIQISGNRIVVREVEQQD